MSDEAVRIEDLDFDRPDIETQILKRIRRIDRTLRKANQGFPCNARSLLETRKKLTELHYAHCGNW